MNRSDNPICFFNDEPLHRFTSPYQDRTYRRFIRQDRGRADRLGGAAASTRRQATIFSNVVSRNAIRREMCLPELQVRETYKKEVRGPAWREHVRHHGARIHAEVLSRQRSKFGADYLQSAGGRMAVSCLVGKALRESFRLTHVR